MVTVSFLYSESLYFHFVGALGTLAFGMLTQSRNENPVFRNRNLEWLHSGTFGKELETRHGFLVPQLDAFRFRGRNDRD